MVVIKNLIAFEDESGNRLFSNVDSLESAQGASIEAYRSFDDLTKGENATNATIAKVRELMVLSKWTLLIAVLQLAVASSPQPQSPDLLCGTELRKPCERGQSKSFVFYLFSSVIANSRKLNVPANPPLWTKPNSALASPDSTIPMSRFCASHLPDWEVCSYLSIALAHKTVS
jgi:hypothetical protein